jgi:hypothetical protein
MRFDVRHNIADVQRGLSNFAREQVPWATVVALNEVAAAAVATNRQDMAGIFDQPSRFTLNAFHFTRANKRNLRADIKRKDAGLRRHYLEVQDAGGVRPETGFEKTLKFRLPYSGNVGYVTPTKHAPRDGAGNLPGGFIQRVLSQAGAQRDVQQNETERSAKRRVRQAKARYFVPKPGQLRPGVWERSGGGLRKVLNFDVRAPRYTARLDFDGRMERLAVRLMPSVFERAMSNAIATARR